MKINQKMPVGGDSVALSQVCRNSAKLLAVSLYNANLNKEGAL